jgi:hypothetical protein
LSGLRIVEAHRAGGTEDHVDVNSWSSNGEENIGRST